ncbi:MAG: acetate kinase [Chlamydiales bacterium]|jgi:acetate kinase|nr:acetate kinase [Chlamydiales bacterium]
MKEKKRMLVINSGSSSIKATLFLGRERLRDWQASHLNAKGEEGHVLAARDALGQIFQEAGEIEVAAHRFVHGGGRYSAPARIDKEVLNHLKALSELAPLHNPACLMGIEEARAHFPSAEQYVIFDTAFHASLPQVAASYAIEREVAEKLGLRRFGFHGISHSFLWRRYQSVAGSQGKAITLHLGNGCSIAAIDSGQVRDTSMGFTPNAGLVMGTRSGDIDAMAVLYLQEKLGLSLEEVGDLLNKKSGLYGVSGESSDMETLLLSSKPAAKFAIELFCYRIISYLGAYLAVLKGADALIFSGGIGEHASLIREKILQGLDWYGVKLDLKVNRAKMHLSFGEMRQISCDDSSMDVYVVASDENLEVAEQVLELSHRSGSP